MACDFSIASDLAVFSQAGPKHGSAPDGGSTDFLPLFVGIERAMYSATLCQTWSAHRFYFLGGLTQIVPVLRLEASKASGESSTDEEWVANQLVVTDRVLDEFGRIVIGESKNGQAKIAAKAMLADGTIDFTLLDAAVDDLTTKLL